MAQEFHVVLCFSCQTFQVHQVKKASRWSCKLCGEKQSLLKEFGRGSARDCRRHVQKLNSRRGALMQEQESNALSLWTQMEANEDDDKEQRENKQGKVESRWSKYLSVKEEEEEEEEEEDRLAAAQLHGSLRKRRRRRREASMSEQHSDQSNLKKPSTQPAKDSRSTPSVTSSSVRVGPATRWLPFLSTSPQEEEEEQEEEQLTGTGAGGVSRSPGFSEGLPGFPRPSLPQPSSMFDTGEDFDEFLPAAC